MAELKTKKNSASVKKFIESIEDEQKQKDSFELVKIFESVTKKKATMWGDAMIGFGEYHYKSRASEGDWLMTGFSPRKAQLSIYIMSGVKKYPELIDELGKKKLSKSACSSSCIYIKKLEDIKIPVLKKLIKASIKDMKEMYEVK